jgi:hypothetical protein
LGEGLIGVVVNPAVLLGHFLAVGADGTFAILDGVGERDEGREQDEDEFHDGESFDYIDRRV